MYWMRNGGVLMWVILGMSVIGLYVILERLFFFVTKEKDDNGEIPEQVKQCLANNDTKNAIAILRREKSSSASVMADTLIYWVKAKPQKLESLEEKAKERAYVQVQRVERNLWLLSLVAHSTPLLGLLGTVFGMIKAFQAVSVHGTGDASILASSISEALITTAGGLIAAIPALFFYNYFAKRADRVISNIEKTSTELINCFRG